MEGGKKMSRWVRWFAAVLLVAVQMQGADAKAGNTGGASQQAEKPAAKSSFGSFSGGSNKDVASKTTAAKEAPQVPAKPTASVVKTPAQIGGSGTPSTGQAGKTEKTGFGAFGAAGDSGRAKGPVGEARQPTGLAADLSAKANREAALKVYDSQRAGGVPVGQIAQSAGKVAQGGTLAGGQLTAANAGKDSKRGEAGAQIGGNNSQRVDLAEEREKRYAAEDRADRLDSQVQALRKRARDAEVKAEIARREAAAAPTVVYGPATTISRGVTIGAAGAAAGMAGAAVSGEVAGPAFSREDAGVEAPPQGELGREGVGSQGRRDEQPAGKGMNDIGSDLTLLWWVVFGVVAIGVAIVVRQVLGRSGSKKQRYAL